jgi:hypothetical protein
MTTADAHVPFTSRRAVPEWQMIYTALLERADFGTVVTYEELDAVLERPFVENRSPIYRARRQLGDMRSRWIEAVPGVGYRVIEAREHIDSAQKHKRKARRQLGLMVRVAEVTDLSALSPPELARYDEQSKINQMLYQVAVHHERRLARIESILRGEGKL